MGLQGHEQPGVGHILQQVLVRLVIQVLVGSDVLLVLFAEFGPDRLRVFFSPPLLGVQQPARRVGQRNQLAGPFRISGLGLNLVRPPAG